MFIDVHETEQHTQVQGYKGCKLCAHLFVVSCINGKAFQLMMSQIVAGQAFQTSLCWHTRKLAASGLTSDPDKYDRQSVYRHPDSMP